MTRLGALSLLPLLAACDPIQTADYLNITFGGPAQVDINCANGGCTPAAAVTVNVAWAEDPLFLATDEIEIAQYRVDYTVAGVTEEIPFYADYTTQFLTPGATITFDVAPMGETQRALIAPTIAADEIVTASATLTLGGWDHLGEVIGDDEAEGQAQFELSLADFSAFAGTTVPVPTTTTTTTN